MGLDIDMLSSEAAMVSGTLNVEEEKKGFSVSVLFFQAGNSSSIIHQSSAIRSKLSPLPTVYKTCLTIFIRPAHSRNKLICNVSFKPKISVTPQVTLAKVLGTIPFVQPSVSVNISRRSVYCYLSSLIGFNPTFYIGIYYCCINYIDYRI